MILYKAIIQGKLVFATKKSFDKVYEQYEYRAENHHRGNLMYSEEEIFFEDSLTLDIPRKVGQVMEKSFKNTGSLLEYCAQFAITGNIVMWLMDEGKIRSQFTIEPKSEKSAVMHYLKGKSLKDEGLHEEAIESLTKAIDKYDRHSQAYERRAKVNFIMKKYADALRDYNKSIKLETNNPHAYYGRAKVHMINEDWELAITDYNSAIGKSFALQPLYWKARRLKSICHYQLKQWKDMAFDLGLFSKRKFDAKSPNVFWKRWARVHYAIALIEMEDYVLAIDSLTKALEMPELDDGVDHGEILRHRAIAKKKAGKNGHIKDFKEAVKLGDTIAAQWLKG